MNRGRSGWLLAALSWSTMIAVIGAVVTVAMFGNARAETATAAPAAATPSPAAGLVQGLVGLAIVVALIYAAAWVLKRVGPRARASGIVQVLGGASVGPREKVVVVRFGGETLLLGVASGHVSLLHTAVDGIAPSADDPPPPRFVDRLRAARSGR